MVCQHYNFPVLFLHPPTIIPVVLFIGVDLRVRVLPVKVLAAMLCLMIRWYRLVVFMLGVTFHHQRLLHPEQGIHIFC